MQNSIDTKARLLFAAFLLVVGMAGALWYFLSASRQTTYQIYTQESVSGLMVDAPVEFHGVDVGKVQSVRLVDPHSVAIVLRIDSAAPVSSASVATITSRGLAARGFTGYVYVALEDTGTDRTPLKAPPGEPYPVIPVAASNAVTLDASIHQVNKNFQALTTLLQSLLDEKTVASLQQSADNLQQVTQTLAHNTRKLDTIVSNTERASQRLEPLLDASQDTVKALQTQILPETYKALSSLDQLSGTVSDITGRINRDPSILIRGAKPQSPGPGEQP